MSNETLISIRKAVYFNVKYTPLINFAEDIISDIVLDLLERDVKPTYISSYVKAIISKPNSMLKYKSKIDYEVSIEKFAYIEAETGVQSNILENIGEDIPENIEFNTEAVNGLNEASIKLLEDYITTGSYRMTGELNNMAGKTAKSKVLKLINKLKENNIQQKLF